MKVLGTKINYKTYAAQVFVTTYWKVNTAKVIQSKTKGFYKLEKIADGGGNYPHLGAIDCNEKQLNGLINKNYTLAEIKEIVKYHSN